MRRFHKRFKRTRSNRDDTGVALSSFAWCDRAFGDSENMGPAEALEEPYARTHSDGRIHPMMLATCEVGGRRPAYRLCPMLISKASAF